MPHHFLVGHFFWVFFEQFIFPIAPENSDYQDFVAPVFNDIDVKNCCLSFFLHMVAAVVVQLPKFKFIGVSWITFYTDCYT